jgi:uncharacterized SAM-binding protein YcdF (DUF218 family)
MKMSALLINRLFLIFGIVCILYYTGMGLAVRFGQSMLWVWLVLGIVCIARFFLARSYVLAGIPFPISPILRRWIHIVIAVGLVCFFAMECFIVSGAFRKPPKDLDAIIALGALVTEEGPSGALQQRPAAADAYIGENPDVIVVASGGQGDNEPMSEAACIRNELSKRGIEKDRILIEDRSTATAENIAFSKMMMDDPNASVGLITNNYHVFRAERIARAAGLENVHGIAAEYTGYTLFHYMIREAVCIVVDFLRGNL